MIILGKLENIAASVLGEFSRQHQKLIANGLYGGARVILGQTQPLKPMDEVVGKEEQLQEGDVGHPLLGGNFVQGKIGKQLPDGPFHIGTRVVGSSNHPRLQIKIGHESRIGVPACFE